MEEVIVVSSPKESAGVCFFDLSTGSSFSHPLKNCSCDSRGLGFIGGPSSFSGRGPIGNGDYIVASQTKKPLLNIWQWGKPQPQIQCRIQEITSAISIEPNGFYVFGGTMGGRIFCWEVSSGSLVLSWQAHYKKVGSMLMSNCGSFLLSGADDGMVRAWDIPSMLTTIRNAGNKKNYSPYRSWTPHSLPVADILLQQGGALCTTNMRVISVSPDRTVVIQEMFSNRQIAKLALPEALTSCVSSHTFDTVFVGSSSGRIYILDLAVTAIALSASHAKVIDTSTGKASFLSEKDNSSENCNDGSFREGNYAYLSGHDKAITGLAMSKNNFTLVSASMDGTAKIWNVISRQCTKDINPFSKSPLSNIMLVLRPQIIDGGGVGHIHKPTTGPISHFRKYPDSVNSSQSASSSEDNKGRNAHIAGCYLSSIRESFSVENNKIDMARPDAILFSEAHMSTTDKSGHIGSDFVLLPETVKADDKNESTVTESSLTEPPMLRRQDTFGDEFYDNWEKGVKVEQNKAPESLKFVSEDDIVSQLEEQANMWKRKAEELQLELDEVNEKSRSEGKKKNQNDKIVVLSDTDRFKVPKKSGAGGGKKRYHEAYLDSQKEEKAANKDSPNARNREKGGNVIISKAVPPQKKNKNR